MKLIITYCLICIFLCAGFLTRAQNNSFEEGFCIADSLSAKGNKQAAIIQLERIFYEHPDPLIRNLALLKKARILKKEEDFLKAQHCLERIDYSVLSDSIHFACRYETALCAYLNKNFNDVISQARQVRFYLKDSSYSIQMLPLQILALNELQQWKNASELVYYYICINKKLIPDSLLNAMQYAYENKDYPKLKSTSRAKMLSVFLPGLGQLYAGYPGEAFLNLTFTMSSLAIAGISFYYTYYFTGYFVGLTLFQKFYFGANHRVEYLVNKRNYEKTRAFNNNIRQVVINIEKLKE